MAWWAWVVVGGLLLGAELTFVDAAFYLVFVGLAAITTGLLELAGLQLDVWVQWIVFAVLSATSMVFFRKQLYQKLRVVETEYKSGPAGEYLQMEENLEPGKSCRMMHRGSTWTVLNAGSEMVEQGLSVQIDGVNGLTLIINKPQDDV